MNRGAFKFVLANDKTLYIGFAHSDYHMDICGDLDRYQIRSAGYLAYYVDLLDENQAPEWIPNGSSEGYGIGIGHDDLDDIKAALASMSDVDIVEQMDDSCRVKMKIA